MDQTCERMTDNRPVYTTLLESCLFIILHHFQLYSTAVDLTEEESKSVAALKTSDVLTLVFSKIQRTLQVSDMNTTSTY